MKGIRDKFVQMIKIQLSFKIFKYKVTGNNSTGCTTKTINLSSRSSNRGSSRIRTSRRTPRNSSWWWCGRLMENNIC